MATKSLTYSDADIYELEKYHYPQEENNFYTSSNEELDCINNESKELYDELTDLSSPEINPFRYLIEKSSQGIYRMMLNRWRSINNSFQEIDINPLQSIQETIDKSAYIYELKDNWDKEGSVGYTYETWSKATDFIYQNCQKHWLQYHQDIPIPSIGLGPEGSIDIIWKYNSRQVLVNFDPDDDIVVFSGRDDKNNSLNGSSTLSEDCVWLLIWLMM